MGMETLGTCGKTRQGERAVEGPALNVALGAQAWHRAFEGLVLGLSQRRPTG